MPRPSAVLASALLGATALMAPAAIAAELEAASRPVAVTVFPDGAIVTRRVEVEALAGSHEVVLRNLPPTLDPASLRVEASGIPGLVLGAADLRRAPAPVGPTQEIERRLRELRYELEGVNGRIDAAEAEKRVVAEMSGRETAAAGQRAADVAQLRQLWTAVGEATAEINGRLRDLRRSAGDLEAEIAALEAAQHGQGRGPLPESELRIALDAASAGKATVLVHYRVRQARWLPTYEARLATDGAAGPQLTLVRRASVTQTTGEDWNEVEMTLSTARVTGGTAPPRLDPLLARLLEPIRPYAGAPQASRQLSAPAPAVMAQKEMADAEAPAPEVEAGVQASDYTASFRLPGNVTVARDGTARLVRLGSQDSVPELEARIVPALDTRAYLTAKLTNAAEVPLLPGEVNLHRDGAYIGKGRIALVATGASFDLGFGVDDRIRVERQPAAERQDDPSWLGSSKGMQSDVRTRVTSQHARPMKVTVIDRIPVSEHGSITVETLRETTPPTETAFEGRRGLLAWTTELAPAKPFEIRLAWRLRWPAERELGLMPAPGPVPLPQPR